MTQTVSSAPRAWRSRARASAAWACPSSMARPTSRVGRDARARARARRRRSSTPPTSTAHSRTSELVGRALAGPARAGRRWRPSSASCAPRTPHGAASTARPDVRQRGVRRVAAAARRRPHRPLLPAPRRPDGRRSRRPSARWPSSSRRARSATSGSPRPSPEHDPARPRGPPDQPRCRPSTRCGRATPRTRSSPPCRELGIGFVAYSPLGRGFLTGPLRSLDGPRRGRLPPHQPALPGRELPKNLRARRARSRRSPREKGVHAGAARARLGARAGDDVVPIPGTNARRAPRGERRGARGRAVRRELRAARGSGHRDRRSLSRHDVGQSLTACRSLPPS